MSFETFNLLANRGNWVDLIWPIALMAVYAIASVIKTISERSKQKNEEAEADSDSVAFGARSADQEKRRYKPLDEVARPRPATPQARTLPYARTAGAAQAGEPKTEPEPAISPARTMSDWERQQAIKQRRLEQIEALRRQQALEQQRRQTQQQAAMQPQRPQQSTPPPVPAARLRVQSASAVRKTPQATLRQAPIGRPPVSGKGVLSRHSVLKKKPAASPQHTVQAAKEVRRSDESAKLPSAALRGMLRRRDTLRSAMLLKEILDQPLGLRM